MRQNKEIIILLVLLLSTMAFVLGYVIHRRAKIRAAAPVTATQPIGPLAPKPAPISQPVDLTQHDGQTIDFSSGQPVVKNSAEDQAALNAAKRDIDAALKDVTFESPQKK